MRCQDEACSICGGAAIENADLSAPLLRGQCFFPFLQLANDVRGGFCVQRRAEENCDKRETARLSTAGVQLTVFAHLLLGLGIIEEGVLLLADRDG